MRTEDYIPDVRYRLIPQVSGGDVVWSDEELLEVLHDERFFPYVVECDEELVAYAELHVTLHPSRGRTGRIERVVVDESHRGNGYATVLLQELEGIATDNGCAYLVLKTESEIAAKLYEKLGYEYQADSINYWKPLRQ